MNISKWFSRKFSLALLGIALYSNLPIVFRKMDISDAVTIASLSGITAILMYYFKKNVDDKPKVY